MIKRRDRQHARELVDTFVNFLLEEEQEPRILAEVVEELQSAAKEVEGEKEINVISAVKLTPQEKQKLHRFFKRVLQQEVPIINIVRPEIIGGIKIKWGDFMLDMSLRQRLEQIRQNLI